MNTGLSYLFFTKMKNQIKAFVKSPAKIIYVLILLALLIFVGSSSSMSDVTAQDFQPISILCGLLTIFYVVMFLILFFSGANSGKNSTFSMSDVTLLFPAPISSNKILLYGLVRQLGMSLLLGLFLLFQYSWLYNVFGISYFQLILIVLGYTLVLFFANFCSMAVYVRFSGRENAQKIIHRVVIALVILYLAWFAIDCRESIATAFSTQNSMPLLEESTTFFSTIPGILFPVAGWISGIVGGAFLGDFMVLGISLALLAIALVGILISIVTCKNNFYEDAMEVAETSHSAITAQKEGQIAEVVGKNVKLGKIGLGKGLGASSIYYKHRVENRRSSVFLFSSMSLIFAACIIVLSVFMRDEGILFPFYLGVYMQLFSVALGRFNRELTKPYLYLIPEPPLKKLLYALKESLIAEALESVFLFAVVGFIVQAAPLEIIACIVGRFSFGVLFTAGNVLIERVFGTITSKGLIMMLYFLILIVLALPGLIVCIVLMTLISTLAIPISIGAMTVINLLISVLVLWCCRNMLQYAELNGH